MLVLDQGAVLADVSPRELFSHQGVTAQARLVPPQAARIALELGLDPLPLTAAELRACLPGPGRASATCTDPAVSDTDLSGPAVSDTAFSGPAFSDPAFSGPAVSDSAHPEVR